MHLQWSKARARLCWVYPSESRRIHHCHLYAPCGLESDPTRIEKVSNRSLAIARTILEGHTNPRKPQIRRGKKSGRYCCESSCDRRNRIVRMACQENRRKSRFQRRKLEGMIPVARQMLMFLSSPETPEVYECTEKDGE